jgi:hypothetical protein
MFNNINPISKKNQFEMALALLTKELPGLRMLEKQSLAFSLKKNSMIR